MKAAERNAHVSNRRPPLLVAKRKGVSTAHGKGVNTGHDKGATPTGYARQSRQKEPTTQERKEALKINIKRASAENITGRAAKGKDPPITLHKSDGKKDKAMNGKKKDKGMHSAGTTQPNSSNRKNNTWVEKSNVKSSSPHLAENHRSEESRAVVGSGIATVGEIPSSRKKTTHLGKVKNSKRYTDFNKGKNINEEKDGIKNMDTACESRVGCHGNSKSPKLTPLREQKSQGAPSPSMLSSQKIYPRNDIEIINHGIEDEISRKEKVKKLKNKILKMYSDLFLHHFRRSQNLVKCSGNENLNVCLNRESVHSFLRLSYKYGDYEYCVGCVMVLLLDRLTNSEVELNLEERDDLENAVRAYNYHTLRTYRATFKAYHKCNQNNGANGNCHSDHAKVVQDGDDMQYAHNRDDPPGKKTLQNAKRKNLCRSIRTMIKENFLLNCEAIINVVNCILCTINEEKEKIYYTHLNANQYKTISDITETGVKYKYEQLARETYEKAFQLAQVHLVPTDVHFLQLASRYISFLYFKVGQEQLALRICTGVFDRTADELGNLQDEGEVDKCLQILSKMRYNIKRWSRELHGNSILFLDF
ncbi:14-3-3 protein, putative [Plasmodium knowlesi strain H]|uniref:14-3-3 protein, putative n=3 Tax=Plasmodium knowlesi TaxID=5850 RepID=A0A5K1UA14_PLAKH|nr:14-3-3 protein, putative [Plasmodium knowlesi strain H]OTN67816.1 putative 14-3-3 protein [Plasmodium knowlesi]CAA9990382.1 14-3-3 protein, putative [Plasmodium knowlesi strain H]SBO19588.1 14-3-3 protein, putative [Plasmodium knowlesi strain H]SBO22650.1 14-3-3 protein, putative [Plasmodium knowlesi strain H]VVS79856.1 14-3-3 protein, putative [Plasmodium knowlesi strain H]|eukprot:XP_002260782.1 hypothetical protein, conserved in Plasmodium species [Plasmodium knowlesi strain H]